MLLKDTIVHWRERFNVLIGQLDDHTIGLQIFKNRMEVLCSQILEELKEKPGKELIDFCNQSKARLERKEGYEGHPLFYSVTFRADGKKYSRLCNIDPKEIASKKYFAELLGMAVKEIVSYRKADPAEMADAIK